MRFNSLNPLILVCFVFLIVNTPFSSYRISAFRRKFTSILIEEELYELTLQFKDIQLAEVFEVTFPNTLDTTIQFHSMNKTSNRPDTFVITGDIEAMWLRDSTNQVLPYLRFMKKDKSVQNLILGVINRQTHCIQIDPYANGFNYLPTGSEWQHDKTTRLNEDGIRVSAMQPELWERKFEIDSLAAVLKLACEYYDYTDGATDFMHSDYFAALRLIRDVIRLEQLDELDPDFVPYTFKRSDGTTYYDEDLAYEEMVKAIRRSKTKKIGMVKSYFRPSDDPCEMPFFVPGNAMLSVYLNRTSIMINQFEPELSKELLELSQQIRDDIFDRGVTTDQFGRKVFAYEADGIGNFLRMDDANLPSLLSFPNMGFVELDDPLYQNTRRMLLNPLENPYYFVGDEGQGIGSPHTPEGYIWPMSLITQILTTDDENEILRCLRTLKQTTAGTRFMHESFSSKNATSFTRPWFAWANSYFGEMILHLIETKPHLILLSISPTTTE